MVTKKIIAVLRNIEINRPKLVHRWGCKWQTTGKIFICGGWSQAEIYAKVLRFLPFWLTLFIRVTTVLSLSCWQWFYLHPSSRCMLTPSFGFSQYMMTAYRHIIIVACVNKKHLKNVGPIRHCEPPHAHSPVASGTVARRLRIDVHDNNDDNDNAWQRGPLWPHGMGPISRIAITCCLNISSFKLNFRLCNFCIHVLV